MIIQSNRDNDGGLVGFVLWARPLKLHYNSLARPNSVKTVGPPLVAAHTPTRNHLQRTV
jgi:hypothetical protein